MVAISTIVAQYCQLVSLQEKNVYDLRCAEEELANQICEQESLRAFVAKVFSEGQRPVAVQSEHIVEHSVLYLQRHQSNNQKLIPNAMQKHIFVGIERKCQKEKPETKALPEHSVKPCCCPTLTNVHDIGVLRNGGGLDLRAQNSIV